MAQAGFGIYEGAAQHIRSGLACTASDILVCVPCPMVIPNVMIKSAVSRVSCRSRSDST